MSALPVMQDFLESNLQLGKRFDMTLETKCEVEGRLVCHGPACLSGKVTGSIEANDILIIDEGAVIEANVSGKEVVIHGKVLGKITASESVYLSASAVFLGELISPNIEMEEGARFEGTSKMAPHLREADEEKDESVDNPVHQLHENLMSAIS